MVTNILPGNSEYFTCCLQIGQAIAPSHLLPCCQYVTIQCPAKKDSPIERTSPEMVNKTLLKGHPLRWLKDPFNERSVCPTKPTLYWLPYSLKADQHGFSSIHNRNLTTFILTSQTT